VRGGGGGTGRGEAAKGGWRRRQGRERRAGAGDGVWAGVREKKPKDGGDHVEVPVEGGGQVQQAGHVGLVAGLVVRGIDGPEGLGEGGKANEDGKCPCEDVVDVESVPRGKEGGSSAGEGFGDVLEGAMLVMDGVDVCVCAHGAAGETGRGGSGRDGTGLDRAGRGGAGPDGADQGGSARDGAGQIAM